MTFTFWRSTINITKNKIYANRIWAHRFVAPRVPAEVVPPWRGGGALKGYVSWLREPHGRNAFNVASPAAFWHSLYQANSDPLAFVFIYQHVVSYWTPARLADLCPINKTQLTHSVCHLCCYSVLCRSRASKGNLRTIHVRNTAPVFIIPRLLTALSTNGVFNTSVILYIKKRYTSDL